MELRTHGVVIMTRHGTNQRSVLPVPYADGLVVGATHDPRQLVVEEDGANIIEMAVQREQASPGLI